MAFKAAAAVCKCKQGSNALSNKENTPLGLRPSAKNVDIMPRAVESAYVAIREAINSGELRSGESLPEKELAERLGVSRTPVREALNRLRGEGLVVLERYRKNYVAHFSEEDAEEIFELRTILEGYAASRAASRITEEQLLELERLEDEMEVLFKEKGVRGREEWNQLNEKFHLIIMRAADRSRLERMYKSALQMPMSVPRVWSENLPQALERACQHHREIIDALRARDSEWAANTMRSHLRSFIPDQMRNA